MTPPIQLCTSVLPNRKWFLLLWDRPISSCCCFQINVYPSFYINTLKWAHKKEPTWAGFMNRTASLVFKRYLSLPTCRTRECKSQCKKIKEKKITNVLLCYPTDSGGENHWEQRGAGTDRHGRPAHKCFCLQPHGTLNVALPGCPQLRPRLCWLPTFTPAGPSTPTRALLYCQCMCESCWIWWRGGVWSEGSV